jgi:hypothetical protein
LSQSSVEWGKTLSLHRRHNRVTPRVAHGW